jgi:Bacterial Ig domain/Glycosyl hydrolases family 39
MRRLSLVLSLLAGLLIVPAAAQAAAPGINIGYVEPAKGLVDRAVATHAQYARLFVRWDDFEPTGPVSNYSGSRLTDYDTAVNRLTAAGIKPIFVVVGTPSWANGGSSDYFVPPIDPATYASFLSKFVAHFAGRVAAWEIWNEPDASDFWHPAPDVNRYVALLKAAYPAIKQADPNAVAILGPTTGNNYDWVQGVYNAGGRGSFDAVGVHTDTACLDRSPYDFYRDPSGRVAQFSFLGYRSVHDVMVANGDGNKPIWMTELGWTSTTTTCQTGQWAGQKPAGVSAADQATFLKQAYHCLAADSYVQVAAWFTLQDDPSQSLDMLAHYGLLDPSGGHKPAWDAFASVVNQGDTLTGPCGDFDGPSLTVKSPTAKAKYVAALTLSAVATDATGVARITFQADGKEIRNYTGADVGSGKLVSLEWQGSKKLALGNHTITVIALDPQGNTSQQTVQVTRVKTLPATLKTTIKLGKIKVGKGRKASISGRVIKTSTEGIAGKVRVYWQQKRGKKWKTIHSGLKPANKPFTFKQKLKRKGVWRVQVKYINVAPYKSSTALSKRFAVKH